MAAARQKEMNDNITVVATTTLTAAGRCPGVTENVSPEYVPCRRVLKRSWVFRLFSARKRTPIVTKSFTHPLSPPPPVKFGIHILA